MTHAGDEDLIQAAQADEGETVPELEPYAPPRQFDPGDEFLPAPPRPIPSWVRQGSYARRQRGMIYSLAALGVMCLVLWPVPFVQGLSHYILPLKWLHWIGLALLALAAIQSAITVFSSARKKYLRQGQPFAGRVLAVQHVFDGTAEAPQFHFAVTVEFDHPETGEHQQATIITPEAWPVSKLARYQCELQRGEYVVLVALPGTVESTLTIYGLLGLNPECEFLLRDGRPLQGLSPYTAVMTAFLIGGLVVLFMAAFDVMMFSMPISGDWKLPCALALGGFALAGTCAALWRHGAQKQGESPRKLGPVFFGYGFFAALAAPLTFAILNARMDQAAGELEPIEIVQFWETTHNFVIRDYEIEYRMLNRQETEKHHVRYSHLTGLTGARYGVLNVGPGRFGYPWIRNVHPLTWLPVEMAAEIPGPVYRVVLSREQANADPVEKDIHDLKPVIELGPGRFVSIPEDLVEPAVNELRSQVVEVQVVQPEQRDNVP